MKFLKKTAQWWKQKRKVDLSDQDFSVQLKPILKIKPEVYLRILFSAVVLLILFLILVLPGIKNNGSMVSVESEPNHTAILIDNQYKGATPLKLFVPKGKHQFEIRYSGVKKNRKEVEIKGRILFSKLFPRREKINLQVETEAPTLTAQNGADRFEQLSLYHTFEKGNRPPQLLTLAAEKILAAPDLKQRQKAWQILFSNTIPLANTTDLKKDLFNALMLAGKELLPAAETELTQKEQPNQVALTVANRLLQESKEQPSLFFYYFLLFTPEQRKEIKQTQIYQNYIIALKQWLATPASPRFGKPTGKTISVGGFKLNEYQGGTFWLSGRPPSEVLQEIEEGRLPTEFPVLFRGDNFYLAEEPVKGFQVTDWINASPQKVIRWQKVGKVNRYYAPVSNGEPNVGVSWFVAEAYLNSKGLRLPSIAELYGTRLNPNGKGHQKMNADLSPAELSEWTAESWTIHTLLNGSNFPERAVYLLDEGNPQFVSFPANFCTETTTFRAAYGKGVKPIGIRF